MKDEIWNKINEEKVKLIDRISDYLNNFSVHLVEQIDEIEWDFNEDINMVIYDGDYFSLMLQIFFEEETFIGELGTSRRSGLIELYSSGYIFQFKYGLFEIEPLKLDGHPEVLGTLISDDYYPQDIDYKEAIIKSLESNLQKIYDFLLNIDDVKLKELFNKLIEEYNNEMSKSSLALLFKSNMGGCNDWRYGSIIEHIKHLGKYGKVYWCIGIPGSHSSGFKYPNISKAYIYDTKTHKITYICEVEIIDIKSNIPKELLKEEYVPDFRKEQWENGDSFYWVLIKDIKELKEPLKDIYEIRKFDFPNNYLVDGKYGFAYIIDPELDYWDNCQ
ncbi:MAG: hypothetical protein ACTSPP_09815 [Candidatus Heimdallarchaeaceae archaeon]